MPKIEHDGSLSIPMEEWYNLGKAILVDIIPTRKQLLNYDTSWISKFYYKTSDGENLLRSSDKSLKAPYEISFDYRKHPITDWGTFHYIGDFQMTNELAVIREGLIKLFHDKGLLYKGDNICPRVKNILVENGKLLLEIEKATYFDQVATNLSLDYALKKEDAESINAKTLREWDINQSKTKYGFLPTFSKSKLANTIGVALGITVTNKKGEKVFLIRQRTSNVAVAAKMNALPFSFSLNLETKGLNAGKESSIFDLIKSDFRHEQSEELGLEPGIIDFEKVKPLLLCRELCRGGKPQFFFEIELDIPFEDIKKQIKENLINKREYSNTIVGLTIEKARKSLNKFSPEIRAFIIAKS